MGLRSRTRLPIGRSPRERERAACPSHAVEDVFCVIEAGSVQPISLPPWSVGAVATANVQNGPSASAPISAESVRPPAPVNLAAEIQASGDLEISWTRRSRGGWAWIDEVDAPLSERVEQYRVSLAGAASATEFVADQPNLAVAAAVVAELGTGQATIEIRQIGDFAASRPAQLSINIP